MAELIGSIKTSDGRRRVRLYFTLNKEKTLFRLVWELGENTGSFDITGTSRDEVLQKTKRRFLDSDWDLRLNKAADWN